MCGLPERLADWPTKHRLRFSVQPWLMMTLQRAKEDEECLVKREVLSCVVLSGSIAHDCEQTAFCLFFSF